MSTAAIISALLQLMRVANQWGVDWNEMRRLVERDEEPTQAEIEALAQSARTDVDNI